MSKTVDITTLSGFSNLSAGTYNMGVKAHGTGVYVDSPTASASTYTIYSLAATGTNCQVNGVASYNGTIGQSQNLTLTITADGSDYKVPSTAPTVIGATSVYTKVSDTEATLALSASTQNLSFNIVGEAAVPTYKMILNTNSASSITYTYSKNRTTTTYSGAALLTVNDCVSVDSVSYTYPENRQCRLINASTGEIIQSTLSLPYYPVNNDYEVVAYSEPSASCIDYYTQVTMADGTTKNLGDIEVGEYVLSIDFDTMKLVSRKVIYSGRDEPDYDQWYTDYYILNEFSDGKVIKQSMRHRMYNLEAQAYVHLDEEWENGEHCYTLAGTNPTLVKRTYVQERQHYARITLENCNNYFANGLSTGDSECPTGIVLDRPLERA